MSGSPEALHSMWEWSGRLAGDYDASLSDQLSHLKVIHLIQLIQGTKVPGVFARYCQQALWLFQTEGPFLGCPYNKIPIILGSTLGPLILGNSLIGRQDLQSKLSQGP